ncbi:hypothetical protein [Rhodococcus opacus]|uniref:hypothetical protein n=1 Tax=Rhodococcus opacus TaxID=37919 RepID=UPI00223659F1|nr:hypothetical protein [Rhodococcus opacus]UZG60301.1 hypothetical protein ONE62_42285 [Rhodococcus opacus]
MQSVEPCAAEQSVTADPIEQVGGEVLEVRAVVEQEQLADHHRQQRVVAVSEPITPLGEHLTKPGDLAVDSVAPEDPPRQGQALEAAEPVELGEGAQ